MMMSRVVFLVVTALLQVALPASADQATSPAEATVFVRVIGKVRVLHRGHWTEVFTDDRAEIAVGSGFVVSPEGDIVTSFHLIEGKEVVVWVDDEPYEVSMDVAHVDVAFAADMGLESFEALGSDAQLGFYPATIEAVDPERDLALLHISASNVPFIPLGDSDAVEPGQDIKILGYPMGWEANVGRSDQYSAVPQVSVNRGSLSAVRYGDDNRPRYLQSDGAVNPGNSGGPVVDEDGYVLGVVDLKSIDGSGVSYSIPINRVKEFLEEKGYAWLFPSGRFELGSWDTFEGKGVQIRPLVGFTDRAPGRLLVECSEPSNDVVLRIDRVASLWSLEKLEQSLLAGGFGDHSGTFESGRSRHGRRGRSSVLLGHAAGLDPVRSQLLRMEYAIADLGKEKLVARYIGPASAVAFNLGVLRASLESLRFEPLLTGELRGAVEVNWTREPMPHNLGPDVLLPSGWIHDEVGAYPCEGLPEPDSVVAASPPEDFTVSLGLSWWESPGVDVREAASACSPNPGRFGAASYLYGVNWYGVSYAVEGLFVPADGGLLQLEVSTPVAKRAYVFPLFNDWVRRSRVDSRASRAAKRPE